MKKMKKVFAMLLAFAMVMGMSLTTFAAERTEATITVNNASGAELSYVQVIKPDQTTRTGWAFVEGMADYYKTAFNLQDEQAIIDALIADDGTSANIATALAAIPTAAFAEMENPQTVSVAGVYAIRAIETGYTYKTMAAYVGFGEVTIDGTEYEYPSLLDATVDAKKSSTSVDKEVEDSDKVVEIGQELDYEIEAYVPYFDVNVTNKTFTISDTLVGGQYIEDSVEVKMGDDVVDVTPVFSTENESFTINLGSLINDTNSNAGNKITVTYKAVVTEVTVNNTAYSNVGGMDYNSGDPVRVYTGNVTLTKKDSDTKETLEGAKFVVYKVNSDNSKSYATFDADLELTGWVATEDAATRVETGSEGTVTVKGLGLGTYWFKEVEAPKGYSVNTTDVSATVALPEGTDEATAELPATTEMLDTKLSALPSTGGIGTAIFTIGGCAIMIAAAYFFFVNRKKEA